MTNSKLVYSFEEGGKELITRFGKKGAFLSELYKQGLPVPCGILLSIEAVNIIIKEKEIPDFLWGMILNDVKNLKDHFKKFHGSESFFLLAVRSSGIISMPGILESVLNVGITENGFEKFSKAFQDKWQPVYMAAELILKLADLASDVNSNQIHTILEAIKHEEQVSSKHKITYKGLEKFLRVAKRVLIEKFKSSLFEDSLLQLKLAIESVTKSWDSSRANFFRESAGIPYTLGMGIVIMPMIFGNLNEHSGTGVMFTRNPLSGSDELYGDYLPAYQGDKLVSGIIDPNPIDSLLEKQPQNFKNLVKIGKKIERIFKEVQEVEFTIENGKLWFLQAKNGKTTSRAKLRILEDFIVENLISVDEAKHRLISFNLDEQTIKVFKEEEKKSFPLLCKGIGVSNQVAVGRVRIGIPENSENSIINKDQIIIIEETKPEDFIQLLNFKGIITIKGGKTSHAAIIARQFKIPCIVGCKNLRIDHQKRIVFTDIREKVQEQTFISMDGKTGEIFIGQLGVKLNTEFNIEELENISKIFGADS